MEPIILLLVDVKFPDLTKLHLTPGQLAIIFYLRFRAASGRTPPTSEEIVSDTQFSDRTVLILLRQLVKLNLIGAYKPIE